VPILAYTYPSGDPCFSPLVAWTHYTSPKRQRGFVRPALARRVGVERLALARRVGVEKLFAHPGVGAGAF
jgi:hypothetical protein